MKKYPYSQGVLAEVMREDALSQRQNMLHRGDPGTPKPEPLGPAEPTPPKRAYFKNPVSDEDKDVMIYATPGPNDKEVTYLGPPPTSTPIPKGYRKPKGHIDLTIGPPAEELINGTFEEGIDKILTYGDQNVPDETLNFENGIAYAIAYNNASNIKQDERKSFLDGFKEKTGIDFTITEENGIRYDANSGDTNAAKANRNRCAAYLGGALRAMGMKLDDDSLKHIDQLHAELTGGTYRGVTYPPNPQVRGVIRLYEGGPMSENGDLSMEEQYAKLVDMGIVKEGDAVFMAHDGKEGDLSHGGLITKTSITGIFYSGETTARYNRPLQEYFGTNGGTSYVDIVLFYHGDEETALPNVGEYPIVDENGKGRG